ncbi:hypothetical protein [Nocardia sp. NPDC004722]
MNQLIDRLFRTIEERFAGRLFVGSDRHTLDGFVFGILDDIDNELIDNAALVRVLLDEVSFEATGLLWFERRLRLLTSLLLAQVLESGDERERDSMSWVLLSTSASALLRLAALEPEMTERKEVIAMTSRLISEWLKP